MGSAENSARSIVCLHGLGRTPRDWDAVRPGLEPLGSVTAPQLPRSPREALDMLRSEIEPGSIVIGHSLGGVLALQLARIEEVAPSALVLTSCFFPPARNGRTLTASLRDYAGHRLAFVRERGSRSRDLDGGAGGIGGGLASLVQIAARGATFAPDGSLPPALIVHAHDDHYVPVDFAQAAARRLGKPISELADGGHYPHVGRAEEWLSRVSPWIAEYG